MIDFHLQFPKKNTPRLNTEQICELNRVFDIYSVWYILRSGSSSVLRWPNSASTLISPHIPSARPSLLLIGVLLFATGPTNWLAELQKIVATGLQFSQKQKVSGARHYVYMCRQEKLLAYFHFSPPSSLIILLASLDGWTWGFPGIYLVLVCDCLQILSLEDTFCNIFLNGMSKLASRRKKAILWSHS